MDGIDAARKMVIMTRLAFGMNVNLDNVETNGIRGISPEDIDVAYQLGYKIKLVGTAEETNGTVNVNVGPFYYQRLIRLQVLTMKIMPYL